MDKDNLNTLIHGENKALTKKHIAERQRRARINTYLEEIQMLTSAGNGTTVPSKLEKAEVLERAVFYLQTAQGFVDPNNNSNPDMDDIEIYKQGYTSCMNKIFDHVTQSYDLLPEAPGMKRHLDNFLQNHVTQIGDTGAVEQERYLDELVQINDQGNGCAVDLRCDSRVNKATDCLVKHEINKKLKVNRHLPGQMQAFTAEGELHGASQDSRDSIQDTQFSGMAYQHSDLVVSISLSPKVANVNTRTEQMHSGDLEIKQEVADYTDVTCQSAPEPNHAILDVDAMFSSAGDCVEEIESTKRESVVWRPW